MEATVEKKLASLLALQAIDSKLDELKKVRGALPEEVEDLEDEITGFSTRIEKQKGDLESLETDIKNYKVSIKDAENLIVKYEEQQNNVRNNREYDAISKEIELQQLEIQVLEKRIKESGESIERKKENLEGTEATLEERKEDLKRKKEELTLLMTESEEEEKTLKVDREKATKKIKERLHYSYERLRNNFRNGLAVVNVDREACGGCFNVVPPQRQAEIKEKKKIIVCEHCGRIFANVIDVVVEEKPKKKTTRKTKAKAKA